MFHRLFCVRAVSKFGHLLCAEDIGIMLMRSDDLDILIAQADDRYYSDFCRLLLVMLWNA